MLALLLAAAVSTGPVQLALAQQAQDFDLLPPEAKPDERAVAERAEQQRKLTRRTKMLRVHQIGGLVTLTGLAVSAISGQLNYADKYGGGGDTGRYATFHRASTYTSAALFAGTGLLALLAPVPVEKPARLDTATLHKVAMGVATAGMVAQVVLGLVAAGKEGPPTALSQRNFALAHQIVGYTTLVATAAGFTVLTF